MGKVFVCIFVVFLRTCPSVGDVRLLLALFGCVWRVWM